MIDGLVKVIVKMNNYCNVCDHVCCPKGCYNRGCNPSDVCKSYPFVYTQGDYFGPYGFLGNGGWDLIDVCKEKMNSELSNIINGFLERLNKSNKVFNLVDRSVELSVVPAEIINLDNYLKAFYECLRRHGM